jgi:ABC-type sugar transport system permease subunit
MSAANYKLDNLCALVDRNRLQISGGTEDVMAQDSQEERWAAFGWNVISIPGNDVRAIDSALTLAEQTSGKPTVIILFLFAIGGILKGNFGLFYNLVGNNSMLFKTTDIIETYVYRSMMNSFNFSQSSAVGLFQSVVGFFIVLGANAFVKHLDPDYALF